MIRIISVRVETSENISKIKATKVILSLVLSRRRRPVLIISHKDFVPVCLSSIFSQHTLEGQDFRNNYCFLQSQFPFHLCKPWKKIDDRFSTECGRSKPFELFFYFFSLLTIRHQNIFKLSCCWPRFQSESSCTRVYM